MNQNPKLLRCAIYCRVSTHDQNCDRQESELIAFASRMNYEVVGIYSETASGAKDDRKARKQVIALANKKLIDVVLISELSRWGRSSQDLIHTINDLFSRNVSLISLNGTCFDLNTSMGNMMLTIFAAISQFERDLLRERIYSGMAEARKKGKRFGRPATYNKYSKYEDRIINMRSNGYSIRKIAEELKLSPTTVHKVIKLSNPNSSPVT